jgi:hypothetical protein
MEQTEITRKNLFPIWWAFIWRFVLVSMLAGFIVGFFGGLILGLTGKGQHASIVGALLGWLASLPVSFWALKTALTKQYQGFAVSLVKSSS